MTTAELRAYLGVSSDDSAFDDVIANLYSLSKKIFTQYTNREFAYTSYVQDYTNFTNDRVYLVHLPLSNITSIVYYDSVVDRSNLTTLVAGTDYAVVDDTIYFSSTLEAPYLSLTYVAGYTSIPIDVDMVLVQILSFLWTYSDRKVFLSSNGEAILEPDQVKLPKHVRESMAIYKKGM